MELIWEMPVLDPSEPIFKTAIDFFELTNENFSYCNF